MSWVIFALGALLSAGGAAAIWSGLSYMPVEWGWTQLIAGTTAVSGGVVTMGLAALLWRLGTIHRALIGGAVAAARPALTSPPERTPAAEPMPEGTPLPPGPVRLPPATDLPPPAPPPMPRGFRDPDPPPPYADPPLRPLEPDGTPSLPVAAVPETAETAPEPSLDMDAGEIEAPAGTPSPVIEPDREPADPAPAKRLSRPLLRGLRSRLAGRREAEVPPPPVPVPLPLPALAPLPWSEPAEPVPSDEKPFESPEESSAAAPPVREPAFVEPELEPEGPRPVVAQAPEPGATTAEPPTVVGRYAAGAASYALFSDGTIEVETESGVHRFESMDELKRFLEAQDVTSRPGWPG